MTQPKRAGRDELAKLYDRLKDFKIAMFTTVSPTGAIHSRPMDTQDRDENMDIWFVTSKDTLKVDELTANPQVGLIYFRDSDNAYISIAGKARVTDDKALIRSKWKPDWNIWFPQGVDSPEILLIIVEAEEAEYWQPEGGTLRVMFELARGIITGDHPELKGPEHVQVAKQPDRSFSDPA